MQSLFVTGTDTNAGKTVVTAALVLKLRQLGIDAVPMKPIASGCRFEGGELVSDDALWLREVTGTDADLNLINPIRLEEPLAPLVAARRINEPTHHYLPRTLEAFEALSQCHDCVVVEGVGGLLVPLAEIDGRIFTCVDLANSLGLPVVVAARRVLGTINHTTLTCRTALEQPAHFAGLVFSDSTPPEQGDVAAETSPGIIAEMTGVPVWGHIPWLRDLSTTALTEAAAGLKLPVI